jgi:phosphatidylserine/phosphatidylglycerophosphate/cardiolipin synthase-like enzyme
MQAWAASVASAGRLGGRGRILRFLNGVESQELGISLVRLAGASSRITLFGYTLDRADMVEALIAAKTMGAEIRVGLDEFQTLRGKTRDQPLSVMRLVLAGVAVRKLSGVDARSEYAAVGRQIGSFVGALHAKGLVVDDYVVLGSGNWTTASRANRELGCLGFVPRAVPDEKTPLEAMLDAMWESGQFFDTDELRQAQTPQAAGARSSLR